MDSSHSDTLVHLDVDEVYTRTLHNRPAYEVPTRQLARASQATHEVQVIADNFRSEGITCIFLRADPGTSERLALTLRGTYSIERCQAGGWLFVSPEAEQPAFWMPQLACNRMLDSNKRIKAQEVCEMTSISLNLAALSGEFAVPRLATWDLVIWRFQSASHPVLEELRTLSVLETQPAFLWSSHNQYSRPADIFEHLVFGHVYENQEVWPNHWRICSELEAHALYVILSGLQRLTGKAIYRVLKDQIVLSVIARQREDGGWYHGEWTELMESHHRLHCGGIHLLAAAYEEWADDRIREALDKATAFVSRRAQRIDAGVWFMHDSLEVDEQSIKHYPFRWASSRALGKSPSNMLILNTHLDTMIALDRYREVTTDDRYVAQVDSARQATGAIFAQRPAEALYRALFRILDLTFLPKPEAAKLPLLVRALKRVGWKYLAPNLHHIKAVWPRLLMPNGFIDRSLAQEGVAARYQSVHVWDLARFLRRFPSEVGQKFLHRALSYTQSESRLRQYWKEDTSRRDALGFWQEALYDLCAARPDAQRVAWLAQAVIDSEDVGVGVAPSLLGANPEAGMAVAPQRLVLGQDPRLRFVDLSNAAGAGFLFVNPASDSIDLGSEVGGLPDIAWQASSPLADGAALVVPGRGWLWARETCA